MTGSQSLAGGSAEQKRAEAEMISTLGAQLGVDFSRHSVDVPALARLEFDGVCEDPPILCEAFAHLGSLKAGQVRKVVTDAFKLVYAQGSYDREIRKVIVLADEEAASSLRGKGWVAAALHKFGIEVIVVALSVETEQRVRAAQARQQR